MEKMFIVDTHLDLAMNAIEWNRDLTRPVDEIRRLEQGMTDKPDRARGTVSLPAMRQGNVGLCVATQIARYVKPGNPLPGWRSPHQAWTMTQAQLAWYRVMEDLGEMVQIRDRAGLEAHVANWGLMEGKAPIGYILSLEGADSIIHLGYLERACADGLRAIGPAHYGPGTYAQGTDAGGGLGVKGRELLMAVERLGLILDVSHLNDECFREAMDLFRGPVWASHSNCRAFVPHNRQLDDSQISELVNRGGVIGVALDAWMMVPDWTRGVSTPFGSNVTLYQAIDNIDRICQLAGDSRHAAIGSDLDGAFGTEQGPQDVDTIADLQKMGGMLKDRGYRDQDIANIMHGNLLDFLRRAWG